MKSLFGTLALLMSVSAQAGLTTTQAVETLNGPDCINSLETTLHAVTHPSWTDTFYSLGERDVADVLVTENVLYNVNAYRAAFKAIRTNNAKGISNQSYFNAFKRDINANLNATGYLSDYSIAFASCMKRTLNLNPSVAESEIQAKAALQKLNAIEKAVK